MSLGYNGQSDPWNWDCDDAASQEPAQRQEFGNFWPPQPPPPSRLQHFSQRNPPPSNTNLTRGGDYFDTFGNSGRDFMMWPPTSLPSASSQQLSHFNMNSFHTNNNLPDPEVENKEIIPPDNLSKKPPDQTVELKMTDTPSHALDKAEVLDNPMTKFNPSAVSSPNNLEQKRPMAPRPNFTSGLIAPFGMPLEEKDLPTTSSQTDLVPPENKERPDNTEVIQSQMTSLSLSNPTHSLHHYTLDRNQYLETGHLSSANLEINDEGDPLPPPGLHRLVTGQGDEPPFSLTSSPPEIPEGEISRQSTPISSIGETALRQSHSEIEEESRLRGRSDARLVPGQSMGEEPNSVREVPGEAEPQPGRVVVGHNNRVDTTVPSDIVAARGDRDRERDGERKVTGQVRTNLTDSPEDYSKLHKSRRRNRRESSEEEERDFSEDRRGSSERRRREGERRRRDLRSPEYPSDEEEDYEERRRFSRRRDRDRRHVDRDYSPEYRDRGYRDRDYRDRRNRQPYEYAARGFEDDFYDNSRSRPSSRSGSDYRRAQMEYMRHSKPYFPDNTSMRSVGSYGGDYTQYSFRNYLEVMRRTDPVGYTVWYNQYLKMMGHSTSDRASVHSGQSSRDQRNAVQSPVENIENQSREEETNGDYFPRLYSTAHVRGSLESHGQVAVVEPNYPADGQLPSVEIRALGQSSFDPDTVEFLGCPGPFIPGITHRNTVLQYLKRMSDLSKTTSEKLLYDLIYIIVKGNGVINGSDVSELLIDSYKKSTRSDKCQSEGRRSLQLSESEIVNRFREHLQQGNKTEALEWAMEYKDWGHALFLASKMGERTHNNVMLRFANSLAHNDPLQTLYQLMSGNVPQASFCCADKNWSDWRPHLAMILSNPTSSPTLDRKAIITLGDSLGSRGRIFAAQFCYLMAQVEFTDYKPDSKLVLIGSSSLQEFSKFASCRAIMLTHCYEYGMKLNDPSFFIPSFLPYKLLLAIRLMDNGRNLNALQYAELLATELLLPGRLDEEVSSAVIHIAYRLKMFDPTLALSGETDQDPEWLRSLETLLSNSPEETQTFSNPPPYLGPQGGILNLYQSETLPQVESAPVETHLPEEPTVFLPSSDLNGRRPQELPGEQSNPYWDSIALSSIQPQEPPPPISITALGSSSSGFGFYKETEDQLKPTPREEKKNVENKMEKGSPKGEEIPNNQSGWLTGIWGKLSLRPRNQMRLPDDSNPTIVWDEKKNRWVNLEGDDDDKADIRPPPRAADLSALAFGAPPPGANKYKLQKGKSMRSNYVDVMGGMKTTQGPPAKVDPPIVPYSHPLENTNLFVPAPVESSDSAPIDFISPNSALCHQESNKEDSTQAAPPPLMYNPQTFST